MRLVDSARIFACGVALACFGCAGDGNESKRVQSVSEADNQLILDDDPNFEADDVLGGDELDAELSLGLADPSSPIVSIAIAEQGRGPKKVGINFKAYPFDLGRYLAKDEAWCSEFVSWAYKVGGGPFTDGSEGGWMLKGSQQIRGWFQKHKQFINRSAANWKTFAVSPGDYIRYNNSNGGHSGIVRYEKDKTLYTVEGNVSNKVVLRSVKNWRDKEDVDGIGRFPASAPPPSATPAVPPSDAGIFLPPLLMR